MDITDLHGIEIRIDGELVYHATIGYRPKDNQEMVRLFQDLLGVMQSPDVEDGEMFPDKAL